MVLRAWEGAFVTLVSEPLLNELIAVGTTSPYLRDRIEPVALTEFADRLWEIGEHVDVTGTQAWLGLGGPNDAYLLEMAIVEAADWLVTGDNGVLAAADRIPDVAIGTSAAFLESLGDEHRDRLARS